MSKDSVTLKEITDKYGIYAKILNLYINTFNLKISTYDSKTGRISNIVEFRSYDDATQILISKFLEHYDEIMAFQKDYYEKKTIELIAERIEKTEDETITYLENIFPDFRVNDIHFSTFKKELNKNDKISFLSSFSILKGMQENEILSKIRNLISK